MQNFEKMSDLIGYKGTGRVRALYRFLVRSNIYNLKGRDIRNGTIVDRQCRSMDEFKHEIETIPEEYLSGLTEKCKEHISEKNYNGLIFPGRCDFCGSRAGFSFPVDFDKITSFREAGGCTGCGLLIRVRIIMTEVKKMIESGKRDIYMYESGEILKMAKKMGAHAIGSEYIDFKLKSGEIVDGILHEDAHDLSFNDNQFDIVVSRDVFEHVNDYEKCLKEMYRVLRCGGRALITIPWNPKEKDNNRRAELKGDGTVLHIEQPKYHWNPTTGKRDSLVFWDYGWEFLDKLRDTGFYDAYVQCFHDAQKGYVGEVATYFVAIK